MNEGLGEKPEELWLKEGRRKKKDKKERKRIWENIDIIITAIITIGGRAR